MTVAHVAVVFLAERSRGTISCRAKYPTCGGRISKTCIVCLMHVATGRCLQRAGPEKRRQENLLLDSVGLQLSHFVSWLRASTKRSSFLRATAASRTLPWLLSGWGCRGRRLAQADKRGIHHWKFFIRITSLVWLPHARAARLPSGDHANRNICPDLKFVKGCGGPPLIG